jgi:hypothetical protein
MNRILSMRALLGLCCIPFVFFLADVSGEDNMEHGQSRSLADDEPSHTAAAPPKVRRIISLAESINITQRSLTDPEVIRIRRQYWKDTFDDIQKLAMGSKSSSLSTQTRQQSFSSHWKRLGTPSQEKNLATAALSTAGYDLLAKDSSQNETSSSRVALIGPRRFDGFTSWERLMQDWTEDIQDYLDRVDAESSGGYSLSNFGRAPFRRDDNDLDASNVRHQTSNESEKRTDVFADETAATTTMDAPTEKKWMPLPVPEPAKDGEEVLPDTDMGDKSKRILIVTTASLPWRTGTAVNPLLRAAYLCNGRKELGGSVTLMLPWLERRDDQVRVYGDLAFNSPEDQEQFIRTWLLESANMKEASEELQIRWYTAWQNKVENSIYSMGDITSLVSADDIDICVLEEPEHLNWYRAPGESWTKKFKHVVGILHTNYFQYALDQPAAVIRVSCGLHSYQSVASLSVLRRPQR